MRRVLKWFIRKLIFLLDRNDDLLAYSFSGGPLKDYDVIVTRYYEDGTYTTGTQERKVGKEKKNDN